MRAVAIIVITSLIWVAIGTLTWTRRLADEETQRLRETLARLNQQAAGPSTLAVKMAPLTEPMARTWLALRRPITVDFREETTFAEAIKEIERQVNAGADKAGAGRITFLTDRNGLERAGFTMDERVHPINLVSTPADFILHFVLEKMHLAFGIQEDGIIEITDTDAENFLPWPKAPNICDRFGLWSPLVQGAAGSWGPYSTPPGFGADF